MSLALTEQAYDRAAIYEENAPFDPRFMREAVRTMFRTLPLDPKEPHGYRSRRMFAALLGLSAFHPRDEIEVMLGVQAMAAHHAAATCFHYGMNGRRPTAEKLRFFAAGASAARAFAAMVQGMDRRQAKPLSIPVGRPEPRLWADTPTPTDIIAGHEARVRADLQPPTIPGEPELNLVWTKEMLARTKIDIEQARFEEENKGLDLANTEGILPGGGMIVPVRPTDNQVAYMGRRLMLMYRREIQENLKNGIKTRPKLRPIRPGDHIP